MQTKKENQITVILGRKGCGKTYLTKKLVKECQRLLIFDLMRCFSEEGTIINQIELVPQYIKNNKDSFRIIYQPSSIDFIDDLKSNKADPLLIDFNVVCNAVLRRGDMTFVVDEIDRYVTPHFSPKSFMQIIDLGRHHGIDLITNCRRAARIPRDLTSQADLKISFNQQEPRDLKYMYEIMGEASKQIPSLKPYHFISFYETDQEAVINEPIR